MTATMMTTTTDFGLKLLYLLNEGKQQNGVSKREEVPTTLSEFEENEKRISNQTMKMCEQSL